MSAEREASGAGDRPGWAARTGQSPAAPTRSSHPVVSPVMQPTATGRSAAGDATPVRKGPRRARLAVKRIDPWSTLKFAAVYSVALFVVLIVAVIVLYAVVDAMGVIDSIRTFLRDIDPPRAGHDVASFLSFWRVLGLAIIFGIINIILLTALATLSAFVYNICSDLVGGVEVTLTERE